MIINNLGVILGCFGKVFFFSSRSRHRRFDCDWSSDVCSSDLDSARPEVPPKLAILSTPGKVGHPEPMSGLRSRAQGWMVKTSSKDRSCANGTGRAPSFLKRIVGAGAVRTGKIPLRLCLRLLPISVLVAGCGTDPSKPALPAEAKPAAPAVPDDIQSAAESLLGRETQVLLFGDQKKWQAGISCGQ